MKQFVKSINDDHRTMPGPTIVACAGDHMVVDVFNEMHSRTTSVNFHGIIISISTNYIRDNEDNNSQVAKPVITEILHFRSTFS